MNRHAKVTNLIDQTAKAVAAEQAARKELKERTYDLVRQMKAQGRTRDWADGYMTGVTSGLDYATGEAAKDFLAIAWDQDEPRTVDLADGNPDPRER